MKKARRTRRTTLFGLSESQLLPLALPGTPREIAAANERLHAAWQRFRELKAEANNLRAQAKAAPSHDELAAQAAIDAGEPVPKPTAAGKEQRAAEAHRNVVASEQVVKARTRDLYDAMEDNRAEYLAAREKAFDKARGDLAELVQRILACLPRLEAEEGLLLAAKRWENNPNAPMNLASRDPEAVIQRRYDKAVTAARKARPEAQVGRTAPRCLARSWCCWSREGESVWQANPPADFQRGRGVPPTRLTGGSGGAAAARAGQPNAGGPYAC